MARRLSAIEQKLGRIREIRERAGHDAARALSALLADSEPFVVGSAAEAIHELELRAASSDLAAALVRLIRANSPIARARPARRSPSRW
jgi:hypothetical protein